MTRNFISRIWAAWKKLGFLLSRTAAIVVFAIIYLIVIGVYRLLTFYPWRPATKKSSSFWRDKRHQLPVLENLEKQF